MEQKPLGPESSRAYFSSDTIVAIASAVGGAIALVRISGPRALEFSRQLCPEVGSAPEPRRAYRGQLHNPASGLALDDALFTYFAAPRSFTGEEVVEWAIHGSARIASALVESCISLGARQALPGEFSFRAVRNGKLTLEQAHAVAELISAQNDRAIASALERLSGTQSRWVLDLAEDLRRLATLSELGIDFSDQNVDEVSLPTLKKACSEITGRLHSLAASFARGNRLNTGVSVTFLGLPNAGKSSLFNALLGEDRSIVSEIPGTTRDIVRETLTLGSGRSQTTFRFSDTAGLRTTSDPIEHQGVQRTLASIAAADLAIAVIDGSAPSWESAVKELLSKKDSLSLLVFTKSDLLSEGELKTRRVHGLDRWPEIPQVWTAPLHLFQMETLVQQLLTLAKPWTQRETGELLLTRLEQKTAILNCAQDLERALTASTEDLFAADVRQGLLRLSPLIGDTLPDDILGKIFSDFCIGK